MSWRTAGLQARSLLGARHSVALMCVIHEERHGVVRSQQRQRGGPGGPRSGMTLAARSGSVLDRLDAKPREMRHAVFHGLQLPGRVSLPIGDFADDPERIAGTV